MEHIIKPDDSGAVYNPGLASIVQPGDTILLDSEKPFSYFYGGDLKGTPDNRINIKNKSGIVRMTAGFDCSNWQDVNILGDGDSAVEHGFQIDTQIPAGTWKNGAGISIQGLAKNVEIARVSIVNHGFAIWLKNEPSCDAKINEHVIDNINIHHCFVKDMQIEGIYGGSTNVLKGEFNVRPIDCNGVTTRIFPPQLGNIKINDNVFDGTGRAAIQLSQASVGMSEVLRNKVMNVGREYNDVQGNGINIGGNTKVRVANNYIRNTFCAGICTFGIYTIIEDNDIADSGFLDGKTTPWVWGIWVDTRETQPFTKAYFKIINNKIGKRANPSFDLAIGDQWGAATNQSGWVDDNILSGNISTITGQPALADVDPRVKWKPIITSVPPSPKQLDKGYFTQNGKRVYYVLLDDGTWKRTNSKYQIL